MLNLFANEKSQRQKSISSEKAMKELQQQDLYQKKKLGLSSNYQQRLDQLLISANNDLALRKLDNFSYNETYFKILNDYNYKVDTSKNLATPCFKFTYPNEKARIENTIKNNRYLSPEYSPIKPHAFRDRNPELDVQPTMRFSNSHVIDAQKERLRTIRASKNPMSNNYNAKLSESAIDHKGNSLFNEYNTDRSIANDKDNINIFNDMPNTTKANNSAMYTISTQGNKRTFSVDRTYLKSYADAAVNRSAFNRLQQLNAFNNEMEKVNYPRLLQPIEGTKKEMVSGILKKSSDKPEIYTYDFGIDDSQIDDIMLQGIPKKKADIHNLKKEIDSAKNRSEIAKEILKKIGVVKEKIPSLN